MPVFYVSLIAFRHCAIECKSPIVWAPHLCMVFYAGLYTSMPSISSTSHWFHSVEASPESELLIVAIAGSAYMEKNEKERITKKVEFIVCKLIIGLKAAVGSDRELERMRERERKKNRADSNGSRLVNILT